MIDGDGLFGLAGLVVPLVGAVEATGDLFEPYRLVDPAGEPVFPVSVFLADVQACGRSAATQRSYSLALLRWFRFLWSVEVPWDQATRVEARDFVRWVQVTGKPERRHWRGNEDAAGVRPGVPVPNRVTGKSPPGPAVPPARRSGERTAPPQKAHHAHRSHLAMITIPASQSTTRSRRVASQAQRSRCHPT
jgi:hypothetical protein